MYLFFDTETNGLPARYDAPISDLANWPQVLQLAWVLTDENGKEQASGQDLIARPDPEFLLDAGAAGVHGLTLERLADGRSLEAVLAEFGQALTQADTLVAHNLDFDLAIMGAELLRTGQDRAFFLLTRHRRICTMKQTTNFCAIPGGRRGYKWPQLRQLHHKLFGEGFDGAHDAMNDVLALMRCFWALKERGVIEAGIRA